MFKQFRETNTLKALAISAQGCFNPGYRAHNLFRSNPEEVA